MTALVALLIVAAVLARIVSPGSQLGQILPVAALVTLVAWQAVHRIPRRSLKCPKSGCRMKSVGLTG